MLNAVLRSSVLKLCVMLELPTALCSPRAYPHEIRGEVRLIQTHISWVFLTGSFAYKVKRPIRLPFLDFSTLAARRHFCQRELELNQRGAPGLYLAVVPISEVHGQLLFDNESNIVEYAVKMVEFGDGDLISEQVQSGRFTVADARRLGEVVAAFHADSPEITHTTRWGSPEIIRKAIDENLEFLRSSEIGPTYSELLSALEMYVERMCNHAPGQELLHSRRASGAIRECHGDLHIGNVAKVEGKFILFDCIEFNDEYRCVDTMYDVAFVLLDLLRYNKVEFAQNLLDSYLERSGDWLGLLVLPLYLIRQTTTRAKINLIQHQQSDSCTSSSYLETAIDYLRLAGSCIAQRTGSLTIMCGVAGSGKSTKAQQLINAPWVVRIRSDVVRKHLAGVPLDQRAPSEAYHPKFSDRTYTYMITTGESLVRSGYGVILDATFLHSKERSEVLAAAQRAQVPFRIVLCHAPPDEIAHRLEIRHGDVSDANHDVMLKQLASFEPLSKLEEKYLVEEFRGL